MSDEYRMTSLSVGDRLVFNDDPSIRNHNLGGNGGGGHRLDDEYECTRPPETMTNYGSIYTGHGNIMNVTRLRDGLEFSFFWWRFKKGHQEYKYDPSQQGDRDDDI